MPPPSSGLSLLSPTRQQLLAALKRRQRATADALAVECYLSVGAVRQHLMALAMQGLLRYEEERYGPGRPRHVFSLTDEGEALFPQQSGKIAHALLSALEGEAPEVRARLFACLTEQQLAAISSRLGSREGLDRLNAYIALVDHLGYLPAFEASPEGGCVDFLHCPIFEVAREHPELCEVELVCMRGSLEEFHVERERHRLAGDQYCSFRATLERSPDGDAPCVPAPDALTDR
jgi:predicted ArsR family transcriptional regulator